jgi:hypothetical protein
MTRAGCLKQQIKQQNIGYSKKKKGNFSLCLIMHNVTKNYGEKLWLHAFSNLVTEG